MAQHGRCESRSLMSAALVLLLGTGLVSCGKIANRLGLAPADFRNGEIDVSGTACSAAGKFSTLALRDGKYELGGYRFEMFGDVKHGNVDGKTKSTPEKRAVFVGTCLVDGQASQVLFVYDDRKGGARLGAIDLAPGATVQSFDIKEGEIAVEQNEGNPPRLFTAEYAILNGKLVDVSPNGDMGTVGWDPEKNIDGTDDFVASGDFYDKLSPKLSNFPWPPPTPSERMVVPNSRLLAGLGRSPMLTDVSDKLERSLTAAGYAEYSYYKVPDGFAVVARMERFERDGRPSPDGTRFSPPEGKQPFSFTLYIHRLFTDVPSGFYRFIVFIVTDKPLTVRGPSPAAPQAEAMLMNGLSELPPSFAQMPYTSSFRMNVLIYEYLKEDNGKVVAGIPGLLDSQTHLEMSGIYAPLAGR
jgi:hypothetical protein